MCRGHFSNVLVNPTPQSWLITSVEPLPRLPLPRAPAPGSNLAPFMSPRFAWIGGEVTTQAPEPLEFRIKTTSNSTPRAALRIDGQTLPLEKADRLEQVDLASPGPVSWVPPEGRQSKFSGHGRPKRDALRMPG